MKFQPRGRIPTARGGGTDSGESKHLPPNFDSSSNFVQILDQISGVFFEDIGKSKKLVCIQKKSFKIGVSGRHPQKHESGGCVSPLATLMLRTIWRKKLIRNTLWMVGTTIGSEGAISRLVRRQDQLLRCPGSSDCFGWAGCQMSCISGQMNSMTGQGLGPRTTSHVFQGSMDGVRFSRTMKIEVGRSSEIQFKTQKPSSSSLGQRSFRSEESNWLVLPRDRIKGQEAKAKWTILISQSSFRQKSVTSDQTSSNKELEPNWSKMSNHGRRAKTRSFSAQPEPLGYFMSRNRTRNK